jgi:hypothetical protein
MPWGKFCSFFTLLLLNNRLWPLISPFFIFSAAVCVYTAIAQCDFDAEDNVGFTLLLEGGKKGDEQLKNGVSLMENLIKL